MRSLRLFLVAVCVSWAPAFSAEIPARIPEELRPLAGEAREKFEGGDSAGTEAIDRRMIEKAPGNLYVLSNLGVVLFRSAKNAESVEVFQRAIRLAPDDVFSHTTIALVYDQQKDYDQAVNHLVKVLILDPKNASATNLLGIVASQKGWSDAAEAALKRAAELDPSYADQPAKTETDGKLPVGDFLTPLERSRAGVPVEARK